MFGLLTVEKRGLFCTTVSRLTVWSSKHREEEIALLFISQQEVGVG